MTKRSPFYGWLRYAALVSTLVTCGVDATDESSDATSNSDNNSSGEGVELDAVAHLVRISTALRGTRPSVDELERVAANPTALEDIVDNYLESPRFGETIRDLHNEALLSLADYLIYPAGFQPLGDLGSEDLYRLNRDVMEAPLRLIEHVVQNDLPYSEIVTADYTLANRSVATVWGLPYSGDGWQKTRWVDGRGNAGILSDSWLFQRHSSTLTNANRGRANAISKAFLCHDFSSRDIVVDASIDLADPEAVADAVVKDPACASCHQTLDPLASYFRGFFPLYVPAQVTEYPLQFPYVPDLFPSVLNVPMRDAMYFGTAADGLWALGQLIADDPRFSLCAARRFYGYFHQLDPMGVPLDTAAHFQAVFVDSGLDTKELVKAIVLDRDFRVSHFAKPDDDGESERLGYRKLRPVQMRQLFADLTGFVWVSDLRQVGQPDLPYGLGSPDLLEDSFLGFQVLAGGIDSVFVTQPAHTYGATTSLTLRNLAAHAARQVVDDDFAAPADQRRLLRFVELSTPDEATLREQLAYLHARLFGELLAADNASIDETLALWRAAFERSNDPRRAWKTTLTALLQDVRIAYY